MKLTAAALSVLVALPVSAQTSPNLPSVAIGYCTNDFAGAKAAGFDYVELGVRDFAKLTDQEFAELIRSRDKAGIKTPVGYVFLPTEMRVVGPDVDDAAAMAYVQRAFKRAHTLGIELIVFGSGPSRRIPQGFPKEGAFAQLVSFAKRISPLAANEGIVLGVEAQRKEETNIINSMEEALVWIEAVNHPNFQLIADIYHIAESKEDPRVILKAAGRLRHVHFANPIGRIFPASAEEYDYSAFFENLRKIGYGGRISLEARTKDLAADGPKAIAFLRNAMVKGVARPGATPRP
jgi:D-psicose/D-tagatose/L-ribulose 3-epimerase